MSRLHIGNTFFEEELETPLSKPLEGWMTSHSMHQHLQFLPFLHAVNGDGVLTAYSPEKEYASRIQSLGFAKVDIVPIETTSFSFSHVESWAFSYAIRSWAESHGLPYEIPDWKILRTINSKEYSFSKGILLPHACLVHNEADFAAWENSFEGPKVLKSCFGVSGRGHCHLFKRETALQFLRGQWALHLPAIAEPWVERILDFSTQWKIEKDKTIAYCGSTICKNDARGGFLGNIVGEEGFLFGAHLSFVEGHRKWVLPVLKDIADQGYWGHVGFDAMIYRWKGRLALQPIVEINVRKTMGWLALHILERQERKGLLAIEMQRGAHPKNLLPNALQQEGKSRKAHRSLIIREIHN